jgi:hypothetical protein
VYNKGGQATALRSEGQHLDGHPTLNDLYLGPSGGGDGW